MPLPIFLTNVINILLCKITTIKNQDQEKHLGQKCLQHDNEIDNTEPAFPIDALRKVSPSFSFLNSMNRFSPLQRNAGAWERARNSSL